jgi:hypothetical protein
MFMVLLKGDFLVLQRNMNMDEIMNAQCRDIKTFNKLVNSYRKRPSVQIEELIVGDETYTTPENILEGWKKHFAVRPYTSGAFFEFKDLIAFSNSFSEKLSSLFISVYISYIRSKSNSVLV